MQYLHKYRQVILIKNETSANNSANFYFNSKYCFNFKMKTTSLYIQSISP